MDRQVLHGVSDVDL